jgi:hypothetical protein
MAQQAMRQAGENRPAAGHSGSPSGWPETCVIDTRRVEAFNRPFRSKRKAAGNCS